VITGSPVLRGGALGILTLLFVTALGGAALAVGADGVAMQVIAPRDVDQRMPMLVEDVPAAGEVRVRNRTDEPRTIRLYAARAHQEHPNGAVSLGESGTAPWIGLAEQELILEPGEHRSFPFALRPAGVPAQTDGRLPTAFVLEVPRDETLVLQAVSLLSVTGAVAPSPPVLLLIVVAAALLVVGQQALRELRRDGSRPARRAALAPA
jgi:hypothetical protein